MVQIRPFRGLRPIPEKISEVAAPPYDVLDSDEAREKAKGGQRPVSGENGGLAEVRDLFQLQERQHGGILTAYSPCHWQERPLSRSSGSAPAVPCGRSTASPPAATSSS